MIDPDEDVVVVTTTVAVPPDVAFEAFTEEVDLWWRRGPRFRWLVEGRGRLRFEPCEGGRLIEEAIEPGREHIVVGEVRVWKPGERLELEVRDRANAWGETTTVEIEFAAEGARTRVTVRHRGFGRLAADHPVRRGLGVGPAFDAMMGLWWGDLLTVFGAHLRPRGRRR